MRRTIFIAALLMAVSQTARSDGFLAGFEDVPVMPGIEVVGDAGVAFDTPAGRIVEAYASGDVTREAIIKFYQTALPQLGWTRTGKLAFRREGEKLTLELLGTKKDAVTVRFELGPTPK